MEFELSCEVTVSATTVVEAETLEEAIAIAWDREVVLGFIGSGYSRDEAWLIEDVDGTPTNIRGRGPTP